MSISYDAYCAANKRLSEVFNAVEALVGVDEKDPPSMRELWRTDSFLKGDNTPEECAEELLEKQAESRSLY